MRDVSRAEYDAALARVRRAGLLAGAPHHLSIAERLTLAALGLDEPPTEQRPFDVRDHPMAFPATADALREQIANEVEAMSSPLLEERVALSGVVLSAVAARIRSGPPAEPPKADEPPTEATAHNGIPDDFWREVPCGHPPDPVAARVDHGWTCHCGGGLDPKDAISDGTVEGAPGPIVACGKCGCHVAG